MFFNWKKSLLKTAKTVLLCGLIQHEVKLPLS
jgi:hypothetical protein